MLTRDCETCGKTFSAKSARARFCSTQCRMRANYLKRAGIQPIGDARRARPVEVPEDLAQRTRAELEAAGIADSFKARACLLAAEQLERANAVGGDSLAGFGSLLDRYFNLMERTIESAAANAVILDPFDELRKRREARQRAG